MYVKSPLNYSGNKFKLLDKLFEMFPKDIEVFVDVFGGSLTVGANVDCNKVVYNEVDKNVFGLVKGICDSSDNIVQELELIEQKHFNSNDTEGDYYKLRDYYNNIDRNWKNLFILQCYSFCNIVRFNRKSIFNSSFGNLNFNDNVKSNLKNFKEKIKNKKIKFLSVDYKELLQKENNIKNIFYYCDPPYIISEAAYNKAGYGWTEKDEIELLEHLDKINDRGDKFAISNVFYHKGMENKVLIDWSKKYKVTYFKGIKYSNWGTQNTEKGTVEVLITNY